MVRFLLERYPKNDVREYLKKLNKFSYSKKANPAMPGFAFFVNECINQISGNGAKKFASSVQRLFCPNTSDFPAGCQTIHHLFL